ncbi:MAG TPA: hypothetical protein PK771_09350, partial [Spirochaetota bacterium]|nr:hypothetical protein [Spirochaetota bacterium]
EKLPMFIENQESIYNKLSREINSKLPRKIEILVFDIFLLNGSEELNLYFNKNFKTIMKNKQYIYNYSLFFFEDLKNDKDIKDYNFIKNYNEQELSAYAKYINKDAILVASVTIVEEKNKKIWDNTQLKFLKKNIALIQGNIFSVETKESMLRFAYYFYYD